MRVRSDLGRRVELVPMDPHHHGITVGLYVRDSPDGPWATVHSYSGRPGTAERVAGIADAMAVLGGMDRGPGPQVRFTCGTWHAAAAKRLFLEAAKLSPSEPPQPRPLEVPDTRTEQTIRLEPLGDGAYEVHATGMADGEPSRAPAIARAIVKLSQLEAAGEDRPVVAFPCGRPHDELIALLLKRAQNLRAALREEEMQASRGVLAAPSAQE